jgi:pyruvate formate lyase activating enzyme
MKIAGVQKLTLLDFPQRIACTVFLAGCNMRCGYCHNKELVLPECIARVSESFIDEKVFFNFLNQRRNLLDGVCITGGEPTLHPQLFGFIDQIKSMGFQVKLDTNGTNYRVLEKLINANLLDYVAMDVKASGELYGELTKISTILTEHVEKSKKLLLSGVVDYEFRTTVIQEFHNELEFERLLDSIKGAKRYFIQNFRSKSGCLDVDFERFHGFSDEQLEFMMQVALEKVAFCGVRK